MSETNSTFSAPGLEAEVKDGLDEAFGPVTHRFYVEFPAEFGTEYYNRAWVGMNFPVRRQLQNWPEEYQDGETEGISQSELEVQILVEDAVLSFIEREKQDVANFYGSRYAPNATLRFAGHMGIVMNNELTQKEKSDFLKRKAGKFGTSGYIKFIDEEISQEG